MSTGSRLEARGVRLSRIALGAAPLGNLYRELSDEEAAATVTEAWRGGVRYVDTAPHYGLGLSERRVGTALQGLPRDEVVVSSKVGRLLRPNPRPAERDDDIFEVPGDLVRVHDYSAAGVRRSIEESLERMGLDHLDIAYVHDADDHLEQALTEAAPEMSRMRDEGLFRAWGAGMNQAPALERFATETDAEVVMMAGRLTLLNQTAGSLFETCRRTGVAVVAVGVFNSGLLAEDEPSEGAFFEYHPAPAEVLERARRIARVCREHGTTLPAAAIAYPLREPAVVSVALGAQSAQQVRENLARAAADVPDELFDDLAEQGLVPAHG